MSPKRGSSGACGTASAEKLVGADGAMWLVILCSLIKEGEVAIGREDEDEDEDGDGNEA